MVVALKFLHSSHKERIMSNNSISTTSKNQEEQQDDSYLVLLAGASATQGTEVSALTVDTALSTPPNHTSTKKRLANSSSSTTIPFVKSKRVGLSTTVMPISAEQFISNDDKKTQYAQFLRKPHADASIIYKLMAPPSSYNSDNWKYFHLVGYYKDSPKELHNEHNVDCEYACCNICGTTVVCKRTLKGGTTRSTGAGLKSHLESVHKIYKENNDGSKSHIVTIPEQFGKQEVPKYVNKEEKQEQIIDATLKWIIKDCLPIDTTESISYQNLMKVAYHGYKNISNKLVKEKLYLLATKVRRQIKSMVGENTVTMTSDHWTSIAKQNYEGMTIHWIDDKWKLHSLPCGCFLHEGDSKSASLSQSFFRNIFEGLGLDELTIISIVTDTTSNMNKFGIIMKDDNTIDHIYCTDHVLQLSAKLAYTENGDDVQPLVKLRNLVKFFNKSSQATELLKKQQQHMNEIYHGKPKVMLQDVVTRWWSTYTMVERALEMKLAIQSMELAQQVPANYILTDVDWKYIESVCRVLKPFKTAQKTLEGEKYVTASLVVGMIREMRKDLTKTSEDDELANHLSKKILKDFEERWGDADFPLFADGGDIRRTQNRRQKGIHPNLVLATALDPRTKNLKGLNREEVEKVWDSIFKALLRMYGNEEEDNNSNEGTSIQDEPLSQLPRQKMSNPDYRRRQTLSPTNENLTADSILTVQRYNHNDLDAYEFLQRVMGSDEDDEENDFRGGDGSIDDDIKQEIKCYRKEQKVPLFSGTTGKFTDVLQWWKYNQCHYPMLASLARILLCIPATSAPSERIFSKASLIISKKRGRTDPETAGNLIFLNETLDWYESNR